eukprot:jgi/Botrbrau1/5843/Bobra.0366s0024.1
MGALETAMPKTAENAAVKHFILQSVPPPMWQDEVKQRGSAFDFIQWMADRCTGGKDREINEKWIKGLKQGMVKGETVCNRENHTMARRPGNSNNSMLQTDGIHLMLYLLLCLFLVPYARDIRGTFETPTTRTRAAKPLGTKTPVTSSPPYCERPRSPSNMRHG